VDFNSAPAFELAGDGSSGWPFDESGGWKYGVPDPLCDCSAAGCCSPTFSVRWEGWWRPRTEGLDFNITAHVRGADERVRVWLDNKLLIDAWESLSSLALTTQASGRPETGGALYNLKVEYKQFTGEQGLKLTWSNSSSTSGPFPSSNPPY
jgi:hypothetical protein